jgi:sugar/nucleoside kinase (ribokinase family)
VVILKLGEKGLLTCRSPHQPDEEGPRAFFVVDSFTGQVVDAVGAGDALLAYATLSMVADGSPVVASILGSMAAALECERDGNIPISKADVMGKIDAIETLARLH